MITDRITEEPEPVVVQGEKEWEVEEILDCRRRGKKMEYFVSWKGFGPADNSWEPRGNLDNAKLAIDNFNSKHPAAAERHRRSRRRK
jgi:hypothetical protein